MTVGKYWDKAWSLVSGCTPVSEACDHCWLAGMDYRFHKGTASAMDGRAYFHGNITCHEDRLDIPLKIKKPTVFAVWSDLFHEDVPDDFMQQAYRTMFESQGHTFLILTKRPQRMAAYWLNPGTWHSLIWHGTTVENQRTADERIPHLLKIPGKKFLSVEPMLSEINLAYTCFNGADSFGTMPGIDAVICGCESGTGARETKIEWVRSLRDQCAEAGVPFYLKQLKVNGKIVKEPEIDGVKHNKLPWRVTQ